MIFFLIKTKVFPRQVIITGLNSHMFLCGFYESSTDKKLTPVFRKLFLYHTGSQTDVFLSHMLVNQGTSHIL